MQNKATVLVDNNKVIDKVIDVYLWIKEDLNNFEIAQLGTHLINLADRRATDVELFYLTNRYPEEMHPSIEDMIFE